MTDFDQKMKDLLNEEDVEFISDTIDETGYYKYALNSFRGQGSGMRVTAWVGIMLTAGLAILFIYLMFTAETTRLQIIYAALAVMLNSAQIALKLWFNMQLNRVALSKEIRRLQLAVMAKA